MSLLQDHRYDPKTDYGPKTEYDMAQKKRCLEQQKRIGACDALDRIRQVIDSPDFDRITQQGQNRLKKAEEQLIIFKE